MRQVVRYAVAFTLLNTWPSVPLLLRRSYSDLSSAVGMIVTWPYILLIYRNLPRRTWNTDACDTFSYQVLPRKVKTGQPLEALSPGLHSHMKRYSNGQNDKSHMRHRRYHPHGTPMTRRYLSYTDVARKLKITKGALGSLNLPEPDVIVGRARGWSEKTIDDWNAKRPGRGNWKPKKSPSVK